MKSLKCDWCPSTQWEHLTIFHKQESLKHFSLFPFHLLLVTWTANSHLYYISLLHKGNKLQSHLKHLIFFFMGMVPLWYNTFEANILTCQYCKAMAQIIGVNSSMETCTRETSPCLRDGKVQHLPEARTANNSSWMPNVSVQPENKMISWNGRLCIFNNQDKTALLYFFLC